MGIIKLCIFGVSQSNYGGTKMSAKRNRKQVKVGFHQVEKDKLSKAAKLRGMSLSRFIRELTLSVYELNKDKFNIKSEQ